MKKPEVENLVLDPYRVTECTQEVAIYGQCTLWSVTIGGFIKGILRGVRCTKSLRVLVRHSTAISYPSIENLFNGC